MAVDIIIAQINPTVGDLSGNAQKMLNIAAQYADNSQALLVFPELALTGYPPEDLLHRPGFVHRSMAELEAIQHATREMQCGLLVGSIWAEHDLLYNAALLLAGGEIRHIHKKNSLPNYGVFDERRYFAQGSAPLICEWGGERLGVLICEDGWFEHNLQLLKTQGASQILLLNASPFEAGKPTLRQDYFTAQAAQYGLAMCYVNMVGGQDDIVFDGGSFACDASGELLQQCALFEEVVEDVAAQQSTAPVDDPLAEIYQAICLGLRDYIDKNAIPRVVLGLSGGIDSALVAAIAVDALSAGRVHGVLMPSEFTSDASNADALQLAKNLGIETSAVPISGLMDAAESSLIPALAGCAGDDWRSQLAIGGNLQARFRGNILMAFSNVQGPKHGGVVLNTSNKSEIAVGYSTMYGDACGAYSPLKDVYKTMVYALACWRNQGAQIIPQPIIDKAPTAELAPGQQDSDQLPDYDTLDAMLHLLIERQQSPEAIAEQGYDLAEVQRIWRMVRQSEYKRRQFPPGPKVSPMLFGRDWRYPLTMKG